MSVAVAIQLDPTSVVDPTPQPQTLEEKILRAMASCDGSVKRGDISGLTAADNLASLLNMIKPDKRVLFDDALAKMIMAGTIIEESDAKGVVKLVLPAHTPGISRRAGSICPRGPLTGRGYDGHVASKPGSDVGNGDRF